MLARGVYSYLLLLLDLSAAMQYAVLNPLPIDDTDADNPIRLPRDPPRLVLDDDSSWAEGGVHRPGLPRTGAHRPERPKKGHKNGERTLDPTDAAGAGFGAPCDVSAPCSGSLGLACIKTEELDYRCGCAEGTPVLIEESGVKKCVRAKSMYESCTSNQECSFGNPNLQCVDFLCYCPLPFVLTETRRCLARKRRNKWQLVCATCGIETTADCRRQVKPAPESPNKMIYAMAPTGVLIFALLLIGVGYTYKKVLGSGGSSQSTTSFLPLAEKVPTRRVSSAIRLSRKSGASWNRQLSVGDRPWKKRVDVPKHPPRYIKGIQQAQKVQIPKKEQVLPPEGYSPRPLKESSAAPKHSRNDQPNTAFVTSVPPAVLSTQKDLPSPTEAIGHVNSGSPIWAEAPGFEQAKEDAGGPKAAPKRPSDEALRRILNEGGITVNVEWVSVSRTEEEDASSLLDNSSRPQPKLSRVWQRPASMPLVIAEPKFQDYQETTTESPKTGDQLTKKTSGKAKSTFLTSAEQGRIVSPGAVPATDVAIQMESSVTDVVDKSQKLPGPVYMVDKSQQCSEPRDTVDASQQFSDQGYVVDKSQQFSDAGHMVDTSQQFPVQECVVDKSQQFSDERYMVDKLKPFLDPGHTVDTSQQFSDKGCTVDKSQQFLDQRYMVDKLKQFLDPGHTVDTSQQFSDQECMVDKSQQFSDQRYMVDKLKQFWDPGHTVDTSQQFSDQGCLVDKSQQFSDSGHVVDTSQQFSDAGCVVDESQQVSDPGYALDKTQQFLDQACVVDTSQQFSASGHVVDTSQQFSGAGCVVDKSQQFSDVSDPRHAVDKSQQFPDPGHVVDTSQQFSDPGKVVDESQEVSDPGYTVDKSQQFSDQGCMVDTSQQFSGPGHVVDTSQQFSDAGCVVDESQQVSDPGCMVDKSQQFSDQACVVDTSQQFSEAGHVVDTSQQVSDPGYTVDKSQQFSDQGCMVDTSQQFSDAGCVVDESQQVSDPGCTVDKSQQFSDQAGVVDTSQQFSESGHVVDTSQQYWDAGCVVDKSQQFSDVSDPGHAVDKSQQFPDPGYVVDTSQQFSDAGCVVDESQQVSDPGYAVDKSQQVSDVGYAVDESQQFPNPGYTVDTSQQFSDLGYVVDESQQVSDPGYVVGKSQQFSDPGYMVDNSQQVSDPGYVVDMSQQVSDLGCTVDKSQQFSDQGCVMDKSQQFSDPWYVVNESQQFSDAGYAVDESQQVSILCCVVGKSHQFRGPGYVLDKSQQFPDPGYVVDESQQVTDPGYAVDKLEQFSDQGCMVDKSQQFSDSGHVVDTSQQCSNARCVVDKSQQLSDPLCVVDESQQVSDAGYSVDKSQQFPGPGYVVDKSQLFLDPGYLVDKSQQFLDPGYMVDESQQVSDSRYAVDESQQVSDPGYAVDKSQQFPDPGYVLDKSQQVSDPSDLGNEVDKSQQFSDPRHISSESKALAHAQKLIKVTEKKPPGTKKPWTPDKSLDETLGSTEPVPIREMRKQEPEQLFTSLTTESPKSAKNSLISQLTYVRRKSTTWTQTSSYEGTDEDFMKETHSRDKDGGSTLSAYGTTETESHGEVSIAEAEKDSNVPSEPKIPLVIKDVSRENANHNRRNSAFAITTPEKGSRKKPDSKDNFYSTAEEGAHLYESGTKAFQGRSKGSMEPLFSSAHTVVMEESNQISPGVQETARTQASCHVDEVGRSSEHRKKTSEKIKTPLPHSLRLPSSTCQLARLVTNRDATGKTTGGDGGKTRVPSPHGSLSSIPTVVEDCESQPARRSRHMDRGGSEQRHQATRGTGTRVGVYPSTSSGGKRFSKVNPWGEWASQTEETYSGGSRLDGDVRSSSHRTQSSRPHLPLQQEVSATRGETAISLELGLSGERRPWSPDVTLGSMDVGSSEAGQSLPRRAFKHSIDITPKTMLPSYLALVDSASNYIARKPQKRVSFQEQIFFSGLEDIEAPSSVPWKELSGPCEGDQKQYVGNDSTAEATIGCSESQNRTVAASSVESLKRAAETTQGVIGRGEGKKQAEGEVGGEQSPPSSKKELIEGSVQCESSKATEATLRLNVDMPSATQEPDAPPTSLALWRSRMVSQTSTGVSRQFCHSDDEPLPPSISTALSFISSESSDNVFHHVMDLKSLHALSALAAQFRVTGEGTHTVESKFPDKPLLKSLGQERSQQKQWQLEETQEGSRQVAEKQEKQIQPRQDQAMATCIPPFSGASTERCTQNPYSKRTVRQTSTRVHCAAQPPRRSISTDRQRLSRSNVTQRRRGDDIMRVTLMGNEHYLRERSATSPKPLSAAFIAAPLLIDSQCSAERTRMASSDSTHSGISTTMDLASRKFRDVVASLPQVPLHSPDSSAHGGRQVSPQATAMTMPSRPRTSSLPVSLVSQRPSQCASPRPVSLESPSTESQDAGQTTIWGPGGEQGKVNTIAEAVWEIQLEDPPAAATALTGKDSYWKAVHVFSGDTIDLNSPQLAVENHADNLASNLTFEVEGESRLTPTEPNWDACSRELVKSVKMLAQAIGTPESSSNTIELPSPEDLFISETSTLEICLDDALPSSITDPSFNALSRARTESSKSSRNRRLSSMMSEVPCFESLYNYILESGGSLDISTRLRTDSLDSSGLLVAPERSSGPMSSLSNFTSWSGYRKFGLPKDATSTAGMASSAPDRPAQGTRARDSGEDCEARRRKISESEGGAPIGVTPSRTSSRRSVRLTPTCGAPLPKPTVVPSELALTDNLKFDILEDEDEEAGDCSPFFSFEESASETSLGPGASDFDSPLPPRTPPPNLG